MARINPDHIFEKALILRAVLPTNGTITVMDLVGAGVSLIPGSAIGKTVGKFFGFAGRYAGKIFGWGSKYADDVARRADDVPLSILQKVCFTGDTTVLPSDGAEVPIENVSVDTCAATRPDPLIHVGTRALAEREPPGTTFKQETCRQLEILSFLPDGRTCAVALLRDASWISAVGAQVGAAVSFRAPEEDQTIPAVVTAVRPCPEIPTCSDGAALVTATFRTTSSEE